MTSTTNGYVLMGGATITAGTPINSPMSAFEALQTAQTQHETTRTSLEKEATCLEHELAEAHKLRDVAMERCFIIEETLLRRQRQALQARRRRQDLEQRLGKAQDEIKAAVRRADETTCRTKKQRMILQDMVTQTNKFVVTSHGFGLGSASSPDMLVELDVLNMTKQKLQDMSTRMNLAEHEMMTARAAERAVRAQMDAAQHELVMVESTLNRVNKDVAKQQRNNTTRRHRQMQ